MIAQNFSDTLYRADVRSIRYREIADDLRERIANGEFASGRLLPSESALGQRYGSSRVTVRRALEVLSEQGTVASKQGFGWFVAAAPVRQALGTLGTIEAQLADVGAVAERKVLEFAFAPASARAREILGCDEVLRVRRVNLADGEPFARVTVWCPAALASGLSRADVERSPFYELLDVPLASATQTIGADAASAADAFVLGIPVGSPVLRCERITRDVHGRAVLLSVHVFPAYRTEFVVELNQAERSIAPSGLRLVE